MEEMIFRMKTADREFSVCPEELTGRGIFCVGLPHDRRFSADESDAFQFAGGIRALFSGNGLSCELSFLESGKRYWMTRQENMQFLKEADGKKAAEDLVRKVRSWYFSRLLSADEASEQLLGEKPLYDKGEAEKFLEKIRNSPLFPEKRRESILSAAAGSNVRSLRFAEEYGKWQCSRLAALANRHFEPLTDFACRFEQEGDMLMIRELSTGRRLSYADCTDMGGTAFCAALSLALAQQTPKSGKRPYPCILQADRFVPGLSAEVCDRAGSYFYQLHKSGG